MKYKLGIPRYLSDSPSCWQNFIKKNCTRSLIDAELEKFNAKFFEEPSDSHDIVDLYWVEFDSETDYMWFMLRWL